MKSGKVLVVDDEPAERDGLARLVGQWGYEVETADIAVETTFDGDLVAAMGRCLQAEDPEAVPVPYIMSGGTDAKAWSRLGIRCFGFAPLRLPPELDFAALFHGVDERVPVESLEFGCRVLDRLLDEA